MAENGPSKLRDSEEDRESRTIKKVAFRAFLLNLLLAGIKGALAVSTGSLAITAGAVDSATDSVASAAVYGGVRVSTRKSRKFPYGLYKVENLISVVIALFIFLAGYEIAREVLLGEKRAPDISPGVIGWLAFTVLAIFLFGQYAMRVGKRTGSPTMKAEGRHRQVDVLSSLVVLVSATLGYFGVELDFHGVTVDRVGAVIVLVFVGLAGWDLLSSGMRVLLDASVEPETLNRVKEIARSDPAVTEVRREIARSDPAVTEVRDVSGRNAGRFRFIEIEVSLRTGDLDKAHHVSVALEKKIKQEIEHIADVVIHYEPTSKTHLIAAVPLSDTSGKISDHFGDAPYFAIVRVRQSTGEVEKQEILKNPHTEVEKGKGIKVSEWLISHKADVVFTREDMDGRGPSYALGSADVKLRTTDEDDLDALIGGLTEEKNAS